MDKLKRTLREAMFKKYYKDIIGKPKKNKEYHSMIVKILKDE